MHVWCVCVCEMLINQGGADFVRFQKANDDLGATPRGFLLLLQGCVSEGAADKCSFHYSNNRTNSKNNSNMRIPAMCSAP